MEKTPNKYVTIIRSICYVLIPICIIAIIQAFITFIYFENQGEQTKAEDFFSSKNFVYLYEESINNNVEDCYEYIDNEYVPSLIRAYGLVTELTNQGNEEIYYKAYLQNKNFKFLIIDTKTNKAFTNVEQTANTSSIDKIKDTLKTYSYYCNIKNGEVDTNIEKLDLKKVKNVEENIECEIYTAVDGTLKYYDDYMKEYIIYNILMDSAKTAFINIIMGVTLIFACVIIITILAGRKKGNEKICLTRMDKIPLEIILAISFMALIISTLIYMELSYSINILTITVLFTICIFLYIIAIATYETIIRRIKTRNTNKKHIIIYNC